MKETPMTLKRQDEIRRLVRLLVPHTVSNDQIECACIRLGLHDALTYAEQNAVAARASLLLTRVTTLS
jgi:hypothetical protein